MSSSLVFTTSGRYVSETRSYGLYAAQGAQELSAYQRMTGTYRVVADTTLALAPDSLIMWDRFYGATSPATVQTPYPSYSGPSDAIHFAVTGDQLTLRSLTYPADAPVPTTQTFRRAPAGS